MQNVSPGGRRPFGSGILGLSRETSVFVNCPLDKEFEPVLDAIILSIVCCGFTPRSAVESGSVSIPRMQRIANALFSSKYSIHDFSRYRGEGEENFARFNMPLELGIAMSIRFFEEHNQINEENRHDWLLLVPRGHHYKKFVSDLSGYDPKEYDGSKEQVVPAVMSWLATRPEAVVAPESKIVLNALDEFESRKKELQDKWLGEVPWTDLILAARQVAQGLKLFHEE